MLFSDIPMYYIPITDLLFFHESGIDPEYLTRHFVCVFAIEGSFVLSVDSDLCSFCTSHFIYKCLLHYF